VLEKICEFGGTVNQSSSGIEIQPIATAGYNSGKRLLEKLPEGGLEEVENILEEEENPRASRASISPSLSRSSPVPNQDQPVRSDQAPLRDPLADSLRGHLPYQRSDVGRVFARFSELAKLPNTKLGGYACVRAQLIAESIEQFGEAGCISILDAAKLDDTVNGRGDAAGGIEHWTVEYIFKPATRERLYKAAEERRVAAERREKARARALAKTVASRDEPGFIPKSELAKLAGNIGRAMP
jgi:hypothetical protein